MQLLDSSINILDSGVNDFPRLSKVLHTTRVSNYVSCLCVLIWCIVDIKILHANMCQHFELISEPDLQAAQSALLSEIRPEVDSLLQRVSNHLDKLERREQSLIAKCDLNDGRLGRESTGASAFRPTSKPSERKVGGKENVKAMNALQDMKYKQLRAKKDRLSYAVETLEMQAKQRERQLRMSMAAPQRLYDE
jgi:DASH complex subunit SPC19